MRSRDESTAEPEIQRRAQERPAPEDARIAQFLRLQQSAGNQALARYLLQRDPAEGLITQGAQGHHPKYEYSFGTGEKKEYDLDGWITGKSKAQPLAHGGQLTRTAIKNLATTWNTAESIFKAVNLAFVGTGAWGAHTDGEKGEKREKATFDIKPAVANNPQGQMFAAHFLTLEKNLQLRVDDIPNNLPKTIKVSSVAKTGDKTPKASTHEPTWTTVLGKARDALKIQLIADEAAPGRKEDISIIDDVVMASDDVALTALRDMKLIERKAKGAKWNNEAISGTSNANKKTNTVTSSVPKDAEFNFGLNHLRFILYLEWRGMDELRKSAPQGT